MGDRAAKTKTPQSRHILVVDDDADVRDVIVAMLRARGYRVSIALGGESMRALLKDGYRVDAIILDALMPGESGTSLALYAKELQLPVVVVSGSPEEMEFAITNELQLLEKPFRMQELFDALNQAMVSGEFGQRSA